MKKHALALFALPLLSACFIQPQDPPPTPQQPVATTKMKGEITLGELRMGNRGAASVSAVFGKADDPGKTSRLFTSGTDAIMRARSWFRQRVVNEDFEQTRGLAKCVKQTSPVTRDISVSDRVSVGAIGFGTELQSTLLPVNEDANHLYALSLRPPIPADVYQMSIAGSSSFPALNKPPLDFAMPEDLDGATVNGTAISQSGITVKRSQPLKLQWLPPSLPNDQNQMFLVVLTQNSKEQHALFCLGYESDVAGGDPDQATWEIDASWLGDLLDGKALIQLDREIDAGFKSKDDSLTIDASSVRAWRALMSVGA